ncbi:MAG: TusE/DsrC/DsvC family sulfur relay protein [FCB group bacterium]|nr:TusE/DsrC/DsvC family sulfur relay protein [FCB group bacterium]
MCTLTFKGKKFATDSLGFLKDFRDWSEEFTEGLAPSHNIPSGLTKKHWDIIYFIRKSVNELGRCPLVYQTCRFNGLRLQELRDLFPTGYLRGVCKLAGLNYKDAYLQHYTYLPLVEEGPARPELDKVYRIDIRGFLIDPDEWDENFAIHRAQDMKMPHNLTEKHWKIIRFLRDKYQANKVIPTVFETCEAFKLEIDQLEELFPDGYQRGAVKIAGLRVV